MKTKHKETHKNKKFRLMWRFKQMTYVRMIIRIQSISNMCFLMYNAKWTIKL